MRKLSHFLVLSEVLGNTTTNEGVHIEFEALSSPKRYLLLKRQESFPDLRRCSSLNDTIYIGTHK